MTEMAQTQAPEDYLRFDQLGTFLAAERRFVAEGAYIYDLEHDESDEATSRLDTIEMLARDVRAGDPEAPAALQEALSSYHDGDSWGDFDF